MSYTIQIGAAAPVTLESLGIRSATLNGNHQADESLSLTVPRRIIAAGFAPAFSKLILREDETIRFIGWRDAEPRAASGSSQNLTCVFNGAWRWMNRKYFTPNETGAYVLGRPASGDETHQAVWEIINFVLNHAKTASGDAFTFTALTDATFNIEIPWKRRHDDLCGAVLRSLFAYVPTAVLRWSYTGTTPHLEIIDTAGAAATHTLGDTVALSNLPILRRCDELLRDSVRILYKYGESVAGEDLAESGGDAAALGANFEQLYTFGLGENEPIPAPGLAAKLAAWHQKAHIETTLETRTLDWTKRPGEIWGYAAGSKFDQWSAYTSISQQIARDLFTKKQTAALGVPASPSTYRLSKSDPNNDPEPEEPTGTLEIAITGLPTELTSQAKWSVGDQSGAGEDSIDLPPGDYNVEFLPVYDFAAGTLYFAPAAEVTIVEDESETATGAYVAVELGGAIDHPFPVAVEDIGGETPNWQATVGDGLLFAGLGNWDTIAITGLNTPIDVEEGDWIVMTGSYVDGELDTVTVSKTSSLPGRVVINSGPPAVQTSWTTQVARIVSDGGGGLKVERKLDSNLTLQIDCLVIPVEYPHPLS